MVCWPCRSSRHVRPYPFGAEIRRASGAVIIGAAGGDDTKNVGGRPAARHPSCRAQRMMGRPERRPSAAARARQSRRPSDAGKRTAARLCALAFWGGALVRSCAHSCAAAGADAREAGTRRPPSASGVVPYGGVAVGTLVAVALGRHAHRTGRLSRSWPSGPKVWQW